MHNNLFRPIIYNWIKLKYSTFGTQILLNKSSNFNTISSICTPYPGDTGSSPLSMPLHIRCFVFYSALVKAFFPKALFITSFPYWPTDFWFTCFALFLTLLACFLSASTLERSWYTYVTISIVPFSRDVFCLLSSRRCDDFFWTSAVWWSLRVDGTRMSVTSSLAGFTTAVWRMSSHVNAENPKR